MTEFNGSPFQYNPAVTNVNIDNQLAGVLSQFNDDYIMDVVKSALNNRCRIYALPSPNVVAAFESSFKQLTDGFSSYGSDIMATRARVYKNIIDTICDFYDFTFNDYDGAIDYYSAAYCMYDFFVSGFTEYLKTFYSIYMIQQRDSIYAALDLGNIRKESEPTFGYSKKLFKDSKLAAIHCNIDRVINEMSSFPIDIQTIIQHGYAAANPTFGSFLTTLIQDNTGRFFIDHYQNFVLNSKDAADIQTYIKLSLQQMGGEIQED